MILLIDNYDSFTFTIADYLLQLGTGVFVRRNDAVSVDEINSMKLKAIVISPGPEKPENAGITMQVIDAFHKKLPMLGICLGYQAMGQYFGCRLVKSPVPVHGKTSSIHHDEKGIFKNIPSPCIVMRYHSLNIADFPKTLRVTAQTSQNEPMAFEHTELPITGVQFHPESILSPSGMQMLRNWFDGIPA